MHAEAGSAPEPEGLDANDLKGGTAPDKPVQLHNFKGVDHTGTDFTLDELKVGLLKDSLYMHSISMRRLFLLMPCVSSRDRCFNVLCRVTLPC